HGGDKLVLAEGEAFEEREEAAIGTDGELVPDVAAIQLDLDCIGTRPARQYDLDEDISAGHEIRAIGQRADLQRLVVPLPAGCRSGHGGAAEQKNDAPALSSENAPVVGNRKHGARSSRSPVQAARAAYAATKQVKFKRVTELVQTAFLNA